MSALPPKADIGEGIAECPLLTQSGPLLKQALVFGLSLTGTPIVLGEAGLALFTQRISKAYLV